jgi:hypothetical protein
MATTAALVGQFNNHLRYLVTADAAGGALTIGSSGGATPDLQTDSLAGPIKVISKVQTTGLGTVAAGAITQAQARAFLLSDDSTSVGSSDVPRTIARFTPRTGTTTWLLDANQSGGNPALVITASAAAGTGYLDIEVPGAIGS